MVIHQTTLRVIVLVPRSFRVDAVVNSLDVSQFATHEPSWQSGDRRGPSLNKPLAKRYSISTRVTNPPMSQTTPMILVSEET